MSATTALQGWQPSLFADPLAERKRPQGQLLKWVGNKFRYAELIARHLPVPTGTYYEPFVGTGAVLATVRPGCGVAGDALPTLIDRKSVV